jgi:hypothetical protein
VPQKGGDVISITIPLTEQTLPHLSQAVLRGKTEDVTDEDRAASAANEKTLGLFNVDQEIVRKQAELAALQGLKDELNG